MPPADGAPPGDARAVFGRIYASDHWKGGSGEGSTDRASAPYRAVVERLIGSDDVATVVDVGCGDWQVGSLVDWSPVRYTGVDVVDSVVESDRDRFGSPRVGFVRCDARHDLLPRADLLLAKDVLQHWPTADVQSFLRRSLPAFRYVLLTNDVSSVYWPTGVNEDIALGAWRTLDLERPPFSAAAQWTHDVDVDGQWQKRMTLYASSGARRQRLWSRGNALRRLSRT